ncbi:hypothetical protein AMJ39_04830 [candidate division TA06 bacterium DG_24]|uniref:HEAT repeat domain-containing protein n=2 Tax=Bacteria division TA06 TaxID=1156500 RepID=A0A0S8G7J2_UNCT6|nr:MAG: hypothetical protein AMJ39_04830 [candidate division TA06 bacterium DG_24]KPK68784.1 MAG: hypothetical protein AMJ82_07365 [candidate division TA06 bacterium SM23_40]
MARSGRGRAERDGAAKAIRGELLRSGGLSGDTLDRIIGAMRSGGAQQSWLRPFLRGLGYKSAHARRHAAEALAEIINSCRERISQESLRAIVGRCIHVMEREEEMELYDLHLSVLEQCARVLVRQGWSSELARITQVLTEHLNVLYTSPTGKKIVGVLGSIDDRMALHSLVLCLAKDEVRNDAQRFLVKAGRKSVVPLLEALGTHEDPRVRARIVKVLSAMGEDATDVLVAEAEDVRWFVRRNVCHVLSNLGAMRALPLLRLLAQDDDKRVRLAAVQAAGELGGKRAQKLVRDALADSDARVRREARSLLNR